MHKYLYRKVSPLLLIISVGGCGGGDSATAPAAQTTTTTPTVSPSGPVNIPPVTTNPGDTPGTIQPPPIQPPVVDPSSPPMTMSCVDGPTWQCSGGSIIRSDNGVALTSSGVQAYGRSTSDLAIPNPDGSGAFGLALSSGGVAELRVNKDNNGVISNAAVLLSNLGLTWDGKTERPQIVETFQPTQGRVQLDANGALVFGSLPDSANLSFYDFANKGVAGTQMNYANNRYFPRTGNPSRCQPMTPSCSTIETTGLHFRTGDWRTGGTAPDMADAGRVHGDGDVHAGNGIPDSNGNVTILPGGSGVGVPFPGSKGYRALDSWNFQYSNLGAWLTQDTVQIGEWGGFDEHNKNRRGMVAFGAVSDPAAVPATGSATYSGFAYGWYARNATEEPSFFRGAASITVNFVSREAVVTLQNTVTSDASATQVPVALKAVTAMGAAGANVANYLTGPVDNGKLKGGLSGRYFGPVVATGTSGTGPAEAGGAFSLSNPATGEAVIGGFIARKQ
ncbi:MAG: hypothetical protein JWQ21_3523 [Herminiimonas sp.]|nr:hypothetical protein [Herminiimonas sp.]